MSSKITPQLDNSDGFDKLNDSQRLMLQGGVDSSQTKTFNARPTLLQTIDPATQTVVYPLQEDKQTAMNTIDVTKQDAKAQDQAVVRAFLEAFKIYEQMSKEEQEDIVEEGQLQLFNNVRDAPKSVTDRLAPQNMPIEEMKNAVQTCPQMSPDEATPFSLHHSAPDSHAQDYDCGQCRDKFNCAKDGVWRCGSSAEHESCYNNYCSKDYVKRFIVPAYLSYVYSSDIFDNLSPSEGAQLEQNIQKRIAQAEEEKKEQVMKKLWPVLKAHIEAKKDELQGANKLFFTDCSPAVYNKFSEPSYEDMLEFLPQCPRESKAHHCWKQVLKESTRCDDCQTPKDVVYKCKKNCAICMCDECFLPKAATAYFVHLHSKITAGMSPKEKKEMEENTARRVKMEEEALKKKKEDDLRSLWSNLKKYRDSLEEDNLRSITSMEDGILYDLPDHIKSTLKDFAPSGVTLEKIVQKCDGCWNMLFRCSEKPKDLHILEMQCHFCPDEIAPTAGFRRCDNNCSYLLCEDSYLRLALKNWYAELVATVKAGLTDKDLQEIAANRQIRIEKEKEEKRLVREKSIFEEYDNIENHIKTEMSKDKSLHFKYDKKFKNILEFQRADYLQAIINPANQQEIITVQRFEQKLKEADPPSDISDDEGEKAEVTDAKKAQKKVKTELEFKAEVVPRCESCETGTLIKKTKFDLATRDGEKYESCMYCREEINEIEGFRQCDNDERDASPDCYTWDKACNKCFMETAIHKHFKFDYEAKRCHTVRKYHLKPSESTLNDLYDSKTSEFEQFTVKQKLAAIESKTKEADVVTSAYEYASLKYTKSKGSNENQENWLKPVEAGRQGKVIFGFWALEGQGEGSFYRCYRSFVFESAITPSHGDGKVLHKGDNNEVYFFFKTDARLDDKQEEDYQYIVETNVVFAQLELDKEKVRNGASNLQREVLLSKRIASRIDEMSLGNIRLIEGKLLVTKNHGCWVIEGSGKEANKEGCMTNSFCNIETNQVEWVANEMNHFVTKRQGIDPDTLRNREEVVFFDKWGIYVLEYGTPFAWNYPNSYRVQHKLAHYNFSIIDREVDKTDDMMEQMIESFASDIKLDSKLHLYESKLHMDDKRFTILGVPWWGTFELREPQATLEQPSVWEYEDYGEKTGKVSEFCVKNNKISGKLTDKSGTWKLTGEMILKEGLEKVQGFIIAEDDIKQPLQVDIKFMENGDIQDSDGAVKGSLGKDGAFSFQQEREGSTTYLKGKLSQDRTTIEGKLGSSEKQLSQTFVLQPSRPEYSFTIVKKWVSGPKEIKKEIKITGQRYIYGDDKISGYDDSNYRSRVRILSKLLGGTACALKVVKNENGVLPRFTKPLKNHPDLLLVCDNLKRQPDNVKQPYAVYNLDVHDLNNKELSPVKKQHTTIQMLADKTISPDSTGQYCQFAAIYSVGKPETVVLKTVCFWGSQMNFISGYLDMSHFNPFKRQATRGNTARNEELAGLSLLKGNDAESEQKETKILPQTPTQSTFQTDYPLLAYKNYMPSNNEIVIVNTNIDQPRKVINLGQWAFVRFVNQDAEVEEIITERQGNCQFYFLARKDGEMRVFVYQEWPWVNPDGDLPDVVTEEFTKPVVQILSGVVGLYGTNLRNVNEIPSTYSSDKIQRASFLFRNYTDEEGQACKQINVVIQTTSNVVVVDLTDPKYFKKVLGPSNMIQQPMVVGNNNIVYFVAQGKGNNHKIVSLTLTDEGVVQHDALKLQNKNILFFVKDTEVQTISENEYVFVMDSAYNVQRYKTSNSQERWEEAESWNLEEQAEPIDKFASRAWQTISISKRAFVFTDEGKVQVISLNTAQLLSYESPGAGKEEITDAECVVDSPFCGKMVVATENTFIIQPLIGSRRIDYLNYRHQMRLLKDKHFVGNSIVALRLNMVFKDYIILFKSKGQFIKMCWDWATILKQSAISQNLILSSIRTQDNPTEQIVRFVGDDKRDAIVTEKVGGDFVQLCHDLSTTSLEIVKTWLKDKANKQLAAEGVSPKSFITDEGINTTTTTSKEIFLQTDRTIYSFEYISYKQEGSSVKKQQMKDKLLQQVKIEEQARLADEKAKKALLDQQLMTKTFLVLALKEEQKAAQGEEDAASSPPEQRKLTCVNYSLIGKDKKKINFGIYEKIMVTKDFLIFTINGVMYFTKKSNLTTYPVKHEDHKAKDTSGRPPVSVVFKVHDLNRLKKNLEPEQIKFFAVRNCDMKVVDSSEERANVIQVMLPGTTFMFDLDEEKEIGIMQEYSRYFNYEHYTQTGFLISRKDMAGPPITMNSKKNLMLKPHAEDDPSAIFTQFSELDLIGLRNLKKQLEKPCVDEGFRLDTDTIVANFEGTTIFMLFKDNLDAYSVILNEYLKGDYEPEQLDDGQIIDQIPIRKLYRTLLLPMDDYIVEQDGKTEVKEWGKNILQWHLEQDNMTYLEIVLELLVMYSDCNLSNVVSKIPQFQQLFSISSPSVSQFLRSSFVENSGTRDLSTMKWDSRMQQQVFGSNTSMLSETQILDMLEEANSKTAMKNSKKFEKTRRVLVRILDIEWLSSDFGALYTTLASSISDPLFRNDLIKILISQQSYTGQIVGKILLPYMFYWLVIMAFYSALMQESNYGTFWDDSYTLAARLIILFFQLVFFVFESMQMRTLKWEYVHNMWNWLEFVSFCFHLFIVLQHGIKFLDMSFELLIMLSSIAVLLLYMKLFYWLRLFGGLGFYVRMVSETIYDIGDFIILFFMCVFTFAHAIFVLNRNSPDDAELYGAFFGWKPVDAIVSQYFLGLGEFAYDTFEASPDRALVWIYFLVATFLTNLTFLNMLIAIMGDTYGRVMESAETEGLRERTHIYADFLWVISLDKTYDNKKYLYIVTPVEEDDEGGDDDWEGGMAKIKKSIGRNHKKLVTKMNDQASTFGHNQESMLEKLETLNLQQYNLEVNFEKKIDAMSNQMAHITNLMTSMGAGGGRRAQ